MEARVDQAQTVKEFLADHFPQAKERTRRQMVEFGRVRVNDVPVKSLKQKLQPGDVVHIGEKRVVPVPRGIKLLHEDDAMLVIDKAAGLLTSTTPGERRPTVVALMTDYLQQSGKGERVWSVHRLDKDASGLLILAKTESAWRWLKDDFRARRVHKAYTVLVEGRVESATPAHFGGEPPFETIQSFLREDARNRMVSTTEYPADDDEEGDAGAKLAVTRYRVERRGEHYSLLRVETDTGRKNQIRVHLAQIGHPVVGDIEYGTPAARRGEPGPIGRLGLHASELAFAHPRTGERVRFECPAPASFYRAVEARMTKPLRAGAIGRTARSPAHASRRASQLAGAHASRKSKRHVGKRRRPAAPRRSGH
ncbi:MAG TPA: RluA family pseudouridine synthase [Phycisphaerae bacterium]